MGIGIICGRGSTTSETDIDSPSFAAGVYENQALNIVGTGKSGVLINFKTTIRESVYFRAQLYITLENKVYVRMTTAGTWTSWREL